MRECRSLGDTDRNASVCPGKVKAILKGLKWEIPHVYASSFICKPQTFFFICNRILVQNLPHALLTGFTSLLSVPFQLQIFPACNVVHPSRAHLYSLLQGRSKIPNKTGWITYAANLQLKFRSNPPESTRFSM